VPRESEPLGFGALLREHRLAAALTQEALAERAGVSPRAIQHLEASDAHPIRATLERLHQALQLAPAARTAFEAAAAPRPRRGVAGGRAARTPPSNLPAPRTALIGREGEVAALTDLVAQGEARLVTLTGVGGVGKTRVALQVAAALRGRRGAFPGGVWLVELAPLADPALVPQAMTAALGVRAAPGAPPLDALAAALRARRVLVVLDNCEHLLDACAALAGQVLDACPALRLLATSREPFLIAGEVQHRVPPLAVPDAGEPAAVDDLARYPAVRLFVARAQAVAPAFRLVPENAAAVARVCIRLAGIPLALELAAARVGVLSVEQIAARLDDCLRLLTGGSRAGPTRQQTLRAALDWSHDLLAPAQRAAFRRLAVFPGGFDLEAALAVWDEGRRTRRPTWTRWPTWCSVRWWWTGRPLPAEARVGPVPRSTGTGCSSRCASTPRSAWRRAGRRRRCGPATPPTSRRSPRGRERGRGAGGACPTSC
jgi:transcriptional regulator with XRE-family HTH domain